MQIIVRFQNAKYDDCNDNDDGFHLGANIGRDDGKACHEAERGVHD